MPDNRIRAAALSILEKCGYFRDKEKGIVSVQPKSANPKRIAEPDPKDDR